MFTLDHGRLLRVVHRNENTKTVRSCNHMIQAEILHSFVHQKF